MSMTTRGVMTSIFSRTAATATALTFSFALAAAAQSYSFNTVRVDGNLRIADSTILSYMGIKRGEVIDAGRLNDAVQALRATNLFETVSVTPSGSTLIIEVVERPTINRVNFEGNSRLKDSRLAGLIKSGSRQVFDPAVVEADTQALAEAYAESGRVNAVIQPRIIRRSDNRVDLVFEVSEGGITEIERISFVGNRSFSDYRLRGVLETKQAGLLRVLLSRDTYSRQRLNFDKQVLTDFYNSRGYVDFQVLNVDVALSEERDRYLLTFNIQEGQQFRVGSVNLTSSLPNVNEAEFQRVLRLRSGQVYSPSDIDADIDRLERLALRNGVNFLRVEPKIERDDRGLLLNVTYELTEGPRIFVERIDIEGNTTTLDRVIRNQFVVAEGDPFNPRQIRESAERIRAMGFFGNADVQAREGSSGDQVIVDVNVAEQPTGSLTFGGNYSSEGGAGLIVDFKERNFLGRGQLFNLALNTSKKSRSFSFNFAEPNLLGRDLRFGIGANYTTTDNKYARFNTVNGAISPSLSFPLSDNGRLSLSYAYDYTQMRDLKSGISPILTKEAELGGVSTNSLGYVYSWDTARSGTEEDKWRVRLTFGQEFAASNKDQQFIKTTASATAQTRVLREDLTLRATLEGGMLHYSKGNSRVTDRFFLGGNTMRGFSFDGIGPRDKATDDALGGNMYAVARLEAEFPIGLPEEYGITGGAFVDYGSVWDVGNTYGQEVLYDDFTARATAGLSLFWKTPMGPLRFNFTRPIKAEEKDKTKSFDITISTSF